MKNVMYVVVIAVLLTLILSQFSGRLPYVYPYIQKPVGKYVENVHKTDGVVDAVITWVDSSNREWQRQKALYYSGGDKEDIRFPDTQYPDIELETCILSILKFGKFFRRIYIVTSDNMVPKCIFSNQKIAKSGKIRLVSHSEIWPKEHLSALPVFNSHAIEANLHRIPGLAEKFVYFNDDMYLVRETRPELWFSGDNILVQKMNRSIRDKASVFGTVWTNMANLYKPVNQIWHGPYPLTKSAMENAEKTVPTHWLHTLHNRFRSFSDLAPVGYTTNHALKNNTAYLATVPIKLEYFEGDFVEPRDDSDVVCINLTSDIKKSIDNFRKSVLI